MLRGSRVLWAASFDASRPIQKAATRYTGNELDFDCGPAEGGRFFTLSAGKGDNASPMQLLEFGLSSCALADAVIILKKQRVEFRNLTVQTKAQRAVDGARPFETIELAFSVEADMSDDKFRRCIELSKKHCGVWATLDGGPANISFTTRVLPLKD